MRRIALVGTASSGVNAPYDDPSFEIWGVSMRAAYVTRADRWFELHRLDGEPKEWARSWREEMRKFCHNIPEVLMFWPEPDLAPNVVSYPKERIAARPGFDSQFMTSTFAWMMALAIDELRPLNPDGSCTSIVNGDEISIFGVDMEYGTEYRQQRAGFRHFMALAQALGITVTRLVSGGLVWEPTPYPFWQDDPLLNKLEKRNCESRGHVERLDKSLSATRTMIAQNVAVAQEVEAMALPGYDPKARMAELFEENAHLMSMSASLSKDVTHWQAVDEEQRWFLDYLRP